MLQVPTEQHHWRLGLIKFVYVCSHLCCAIIRGFSDDFCFYVYLDPDD